ncbi:MAG: class I mannose-6-phosphate isomerase [Planctomycetes bacterium]|nr:class I mannose-6-phosphate isomerase [Planctomycetota bacterium]MCP4769857.1 class I mannose-6-phosphate isomerase [Planctomycetota bacterium]MCP4859697.1 class I mannose-6-phosphate isomerase [Planctomycetota bacterium]
MESSKSPVEPHLFTRLLKEKIWGGTQLSAALDLDLPFDGPLGETWELSDYPGEETVVRGGSMDGVSLRTLMENHQEQILGRSRPSADGRFPLLVKFIDAGDDLSVQIHPPDGPKSPTGVGKTEAWYILDHEPGAVVICGLSEGTSKEVFEQEAGDKRVRNHLAEVEVQRGDCVFVPAGQTHAICAGVVLCEVQQTSDVTYRMYDWDRLGLDGKARDTHLQQALDVVDYEAGVAKATRASFSEGQDLRSSKLAECDYFRLQALKVGTDGGDLNTNGFAHTLAVVGGAGRFESCDGSFEARELILGDSVLLPGALDKVRLIANDEEGMEILMGVAL